MKSKQAIQIVVGVSVITYLLMIQRVNGMMRLPFIFDFPSSFVLAVAIGAGYFAAWWPMRRRLRALSQEIERLEERMAKPPASLPKPQAAPQTAPTTNKVVQ
jgi:hypothetical protein